MRFRKYLVYGLMLLGCLYLNGVKAQYLQKPLRAITTKEGLPQSFISGLVQDKDGFVWIGTRNGLARYDGINFKLFQHKSKDSTTISSNLIITLTIDKHNHLWIEYESSDIDCIDPVTEKIVHLTYRPLFQQHPLLYVRRGWLGDADGNVWFIERANGVYKYDWKANIVSHFTQSQNALPSDTVRGLITDRNKQFWILSEHGISRVNETPGKLENVLFPFKTSFAVGGAYESTVAMIERKNGELMFGDRYHLIFFNPNKKTFRTLPLGSSPEMGIQWIQTGADGDEYLESAGIIYKYDDASGITAIGDSRLATLKDATSFLVDKSGLIWLGSNASGIRQIDVKSPFFEAYPTVHSFHYDLLQKELGIQVDRFSGWPLNDPFFTGSSYYFRSAYDNKHQLWIALRDKVGYYDTAQKKLVQLPPVPHVSDSSTLSWGIRGLCFAPDNVLWVMGDKNFVGYFSKEKQQWIRVLDATQFKGLELDETLNDMAADAGKLYITTGSRDGLLLIDIATKKVQKLNLTTRPNHLPTSLLIGLEQDQKQPGILWIGSYEGLIRLNKKTLESTIFSKEDGLPDNTIYAIQADKAGYLWLSTNKGLCRFHPVTHQVRIYQIEDGLPGNEFNRFHKLQLPDGRLGFGGTDGWVLFDPTTIKEDTYQPYVAFTALQINNEEVSSLAKGLQPTTLNSIKELALNYDENTLTFEFAGLEFSQPKKLRYRYQLKGIDEKWIVTDKPIATYTKLSPGHYQLKINATNTTGQWSPYVRTLALFIQPPFWHTWWAYCLYAVMAAGLVWYYIQYRLQQERLQQEVLLKEREAVQLKAVDELKSRFFSNITHEFRTPLTLILTPAQRLKSAIQDAKQHRWVAAIERNTYQLLRLINQLLDVSKFESGSLQVHEAQGSIGEMIDSVVQSFVEEAENKGIVLLFNNELAAANYWFDADKLEQVVGNLIANALKFTQKGNIQITLAANANTAQPQGVCIIVSDTGIGIPAGQLPYIFNRFYQVTDAAADGTTQQGSGIGLSFVKELIDLQGGTITAQSPGTAPWQTCFKIWLPYKKVMPAEEPEAPIIAEAVGAGGQVEILQNQLPEGEEPPTILLVEDNVELAGFIADSLPDSYKISHANNGAEGLEKAFALVPDLVISDVLMPVMNGHEFFKHLKQDERTSHIPVIMLTAKAAFNDRIEGLTLGADDYITKPFHVQELQLRVANLLERQRRIRDKFLRQTSTPELITQPANAIEEVPVNEDVFIKKLHLLIEDKLDDTGFGVEELSKQAGMSRANLHRKVKALTGLPPNDIIRNYRLKRAAQFLKQGFNSSETAYKTGFSSPPYFSKCFKELYHITPLEFVNQIA